MREHGFVRIVLTAALLVGLAGCSRADGPFLITNELGVPIRYWRGFDADEPSDSAVQVYPTEPGSTLEIYPSYDDPDFPWGIWPISHWAPASCRDDLYLIVEAEDGRRFVHEPPLCDDGRWVISE